MLVTAAFLACVQGALIVTERFNDKGKLIYRETKTDGVPLRALLDLEKQAAIELRQWIEQKTDLPFDPMSLRRGLRQDAGQLRTDPAGHV